MAFRRLAIAISWTLMEEGGISDGTKYFDCVSLPFSFFGWCGSASLSWDALFSFLRNMFFRDLMKSEVIMALFKLRLSNIGLLHYYCL